MTFKSLLWKLILKLDRFARHGDHHQDGSKFVYFTLFNRLKFEYRASVGWCVSWKDIAWFWRIKEGQEQYWPAPFRQNPYGVIGHDHYLVVLGHGVYATTSAAKCWNFVNALDLMDGYCQRTYTIYKNGIKIKRCELTFKHSELTYQ